MKTHQVFRQHGIIYYLLCVEDIVSIVLLDFLFQIQMQQFLQKTVTLKDPESGNENEMEQRSKWDLQRKNRLFLNP